jgi:hypothetical protein
LGLHEVHGAKIMANYALARKALLTRFDLFEFDDPTVLPWEPFDGFVAGGCARVCALLEKADELHDYLNSDNYTNFPRNEIHGFLNHGKIDCGDIDIFFNDPSKAHEFIKWCTATYSEPVRTVTGCAQQFIVPLMYCGRPVCQTTLQVITMCQETDFILKQFDICNVKVALTKDGFEFTNEAEFFDLESKSQLKVHHWDQYTLSRVLKKLVNDNLRIVDSQREELICRILSSANCKKHLFKYVHGNLNLSEQLLCYYLLMRQNGEHELEAYDQVFNVSKV